MASDDAVATTIRRACGEDAPRLARLRYDFRIEIAQPSEPEAAFLSRCTRWMAERLGGESSWLCWVALSGEDLMGQIWLQLIEKIPNPVDEAEQHGYISSLYVSPERRGQGVGGALLGAAIHEAANLGVHALLAVADGAEPEPLCTAWFCHTRRCNGVNPHILKPRKHRPGDSRC